MEPIASPTAPPPRERLSIALLMLWTTIAAVLLAINRRGIPDTNEPIDNYWRGLSICFAGSEALFVGAGLTAVVLAVWRYWRSGPTFPAQPGHWLLVISGVLPLVAFVMLNAVPWTITSETRLLLLFVVPQSLLLIALKYLAARAQRDHWRWFFRLGLVLTATGLLWELMKYAFPGLNYETSLGVIRVPWIAFISSIAIVVSARLALTRQIPRDSVHWAGLVLVIIHEVLDFAVPTVLYFWHLRSLHLLEPA